MPSPLTHLVYAAVQSPLLVVLGGFVAYHYGVARTPLGSLCHRAARSRGEQFLLGFGSLALAVYFVILAWYLNLPAFAGEVEPIVASISWFSHQGAELYHGLEDSSRYSLLYGPLAFLAHGAVMGALGPSIFSAKLAGVLAGALGVCFLFLALHRIAGRRAAFGLVALGILYCFVHGPFAFQSRPDSLMFFGACFLVLAAAAAPRPLALVALVAAVAWMTDLKLHGAAYLIVPGAWMARRGARAVFIAAALGLLLALWPFVVLSNVSLGNYVLWLREAARHGYDFATFWQALRFGLFLLLPALILTVPVDGFRRDARLLLSSLWLCFGIVLLFASKPGAGLNHLLPLVPSVLFVAALSTAARAGAVAAGLSEVRRSALVATSLVVLFIGGIVEAKCVLRLQQRAIDGRAVVADLDDILRQHPNRPIAMAYGGEGSAYDLTFYRPHLIFAGNPLLVDVIAVMEGQESGRALPASTYDAMRDGTVQIWLVPKGGEPFAKRNWYRPHGQVFPPDFVAILHERYERRAETRFFELWQYRGGIAQRANQADAALAPRS